MNLTIADLHSSSFLLWVVRSRFYLLFDRESMLGFTEIDELVDGFIVLIS